MKKTILALLCAFSLNAFSQIEPIVTYEGGDLYFIPAKLTAKGVSFLYSCGSNYESGKSWITVFDDNLNIVKQVEIQPEILSYKFRLVTSKRRFILKEGDTRAASTEEGYFLDEWTVTSDVTDNATQMNYTIEGPEIYEDNNNYHSRNMYLSQTLFNDDEDFEFLRQHYEVMPITYCAADDPTNNIISCTPIEIGGETCDELIREGYDSELGGYVFTLIKYKYYGGVKNTGIDVVSIDGNIKKTIDGITSLNTVVAINGNYYVSGYDNKSSQYGLYKIATATTSISKVADISGKTGDNATYNMAGLKVKADTKGIVIRNGKKLVNK